MNIDYHRLERKKAVKYPLAKGGHSIIYLFAFTKVFNRP